ncbi:hypothetical protein BD770DRAFT_413301 [Pilaira anomala]|nr:hypothetical protein BD770DRAFT_413301 [Pilaira anomala]
MLQKELVAYSLIRRTLMDSTKNDICYIFGETENRPNPECSIQLLKNYSRGFSQFFNVFDLDKLDNMNVKSINDHEHLHETNDTMFINEVKTDGYTCSFTPSSEGKKNPTDLLVMAALYQGEQNSRSIEKIESGIKAIELQTSLVNMDKVFQFYSFNTAQGKCVKFKLGDKTKMPIVIFSNGMFNKDAVRLKGHQHRVASKRLNGSTLCERDKYFTLRSLLRFLNFAKVFSIISKSILSHVLLPIDKKKRYNPSSSFRPIRARNERPETNNTFSSSERHRTMSTR